MVTQELLKERYNYDPLTGLFTNKVRFNNRAIEGAVAGQVDSEGYMRIGINKKTYMAHRLAWLYHYGCWPKHTIDHINQVKDDNRVVNLRDVSLSTNCFNRGNSKGYTQRSSGNYRAQIIVDKVAYNLGTYSTAEEAHQAYLAKKQTLNLT